MNAKGRVVNDYIYYDNNAFASANTKTGFYKLKMADKDGSAAHSNIVSVNSNNAGSISAAIYPVPAVNYIILKITSAQYKNSIASFYDNAERVLKTALLNTEQQQIDISTLPGECII